MDTSEIKDPIVANQESAVKTDRKWIATHECGGFCGPLSMNVQVGFAAVAGIAHLCQYISFVDFVAGPDSDAATTEVGHHDVIARTLQQDVVTCQMLSV